MAEWDTFALSLLFAGLQPIDCRPTLTDRPLILERPRIRRFGRRRAPDETVIALAIAAGRIADRFDEVHWLDAGLWTKGQSKKVRQPKIMKRLSTAEQALINDLPKKDQDHVLDAVGIGLYWLELKGLRN
jgi:hypothetical protein